MRNHLRYIFYVELIIRGEEIKRFINMCRKDDMTLLNIKYDRKCDNCITVRMLRNDVLNLRKIIRKTHVHIHVIKKFYPRYYIFRYRKHYSFVCGIVLMLISLKVLGLYVWQVDFYGNHMYTDETLKRYMTERGVSNASFIKNIDCDKLEEDIRNDFDVTWACVAVKGSRVIVYIKENYSGDKKMPDAVDNSGHNDGIVNNVRYYSDEEIDDKTDDKDELYSETGKSIYSKYNGSVYSIVTRQGTPVVHVKDDVTEGQVLVDGMVTITDDSKTVVGTSKVDADADILIKTTLPYEDTVDIYYDDKAYTDRKRYVLILENKYGMLKAGLKFNENVEYDSLIEKRKLYMPGHVDTGFMYGYELQSEYVLTSKERDEDTCKQLLNQKLMTYIKHIEQKGVQIMDCRVNIDASDGCYRCTGELEILVEPETDIR